MKANELLRILLLTRVQLEQDSIVPAETLHKRDRELANSGPDSLPLEHKKQSRGLREPIDCRCSTIGLSSFNQRWLSIWNQIQS